jgi:TolB-like protein/Flp pilus assembly protein TadD
MPPGQAVGERTDAQADLWAIGVMLYEMLTGVLPFRVSNEMAVLHAIMHVDPEPPSRVNKDVPRALDEVVLGLLQKKASDRYQAATEVITDLDAAIAGTPVAHKVPIANGFGRRRLRRIALAAAATLAVASVAWLGRQRLPGETTQSTSSGSAATLDRSVAVLPLVDREGNDATAYLASGIAEEVTTLLGRAGGVKVAAHSSAGTFQRQGLPLRDIAERLGVKHLVDGTVRIAADTLYLAARLTRAPDSALVWTGDFKAPLARLLTLERQVADSLLRALESGGRVASSSPLPTTDPIAYDLYLKARFAWSQRTDSKLTEAVAYFQGAVQRDPKFAAAYSGMADAYVNMSNFGWGSMSPREALKHAELAAHQAIALDSSAAEAYASLGFVQMSRGDYAQSEASLKRAIQLNPNWPWAHQRYALLLQMTGRIADSRDESARTLALDPLSLPAASHMGVTFAAENRLQQGRDELQQALALSPNYPVTLHYLGATEAALGNYPAAVKLLERAVKNSSAFPGVPGALAYAYSKVGRDADSRRVMAGVRTAVKDERSRVNYALAVAIVGQSDSAFKMLRGADWDIPTLIELRSDPLLRGFRSDPRYPELLRSSGLTP